MSNHNIPSQWTKNIRDYPTNYYDDHYHCIVCGIELSGRKRTFCSKQHSTEWYEHNDWNGITLRILERDNFTCQQCGFSLAPDAYPVPNPNYAGAIKRVCNTNGKLHIHHKIPVCVGGKSEDSNLITLCKACHRLQHRKESHFLKKCHTLDEWLQGTKQGVIS